MARRNEDIWDVLIIMPWWVSIIVSILVYIIFAYVIPSTSSNDIFSQGISKAISKFAPYIALFFLIPAPISAYRSWRKRKLLENQRNIQSIRSLRWKEFEELIAEAYRRKGYTVIENESLGADGGVDIRLKKNGHFHIVQCKQWKSQKIGVKVVREMYGVMVAENASSVTVITTGLFTQEAENFAVNKPIDLVDRAVLQ